VLLHQVTLFSSVRVNRLDVLYGVSSVEAGALQVLVLPKQVVFCFEGVGLQGTVGTQQAARPKRCFDQAKDEDNGAETHLSVHKNDAEAVGSPEEGVTLTLLARGARRGALGAPPLY